MTTIDRIVDFIRETVSTSGAYGAVVGLSGGVDSSVVAALCAKALGPEKVIGVTMPCGGAEGTESQQLARSICEQLKIFFFIRDIARVRRETLDVMPPSAWNPKIVRANVVSRLRMTILYAFANGKDCLVAGTSNRTELALGYFTKYGDGASDFDPIGRLLKREVYEVARELGVPQEIIDRTPTAGLWLGQTDEGELGYTYKELDAAVEQNEEGKLPGFRDYSANVFVEQRMKSSVHKRKMPPLGPRPEKEARS